MEKINQKNYCKTIFVVHKIINTQNIMGFHYQQNRSRPNGLVDPNCFHANSFQLYHVLPCPSASSSPDLVSPHFYPQHGLTTPTHSTPRSAVVRSDVNQRSGRLFCFWEHLQATWQGVKVIHKLLANEHHHVSKRPGMTPLLLHLHPPCLKLG